MRFKAEIDVMPLEALLDPQGKAVTNSMKSIGLPEIDGVRIGRHIRLFVDADSKEVATQKVEVPVLAVTDNDITNVVETKNAEFELKLQNNSVSGSDADFLLVVDNTTNPNNALINIEPNGTIVHVPYGKEVIYKLTLGKSISDVLDMTVDEAVPFFENIPKIYRKVKTIQDVGLGYITLGQQSTTLSGGEAQRIKLASFLVKGATKDKALFVFDEPTTGLHFHDIKKLMTSFDALIEKGHSIIVIEHNLDLIKCADWIIDLGPEGGENGGHLLAAGTPEDIVKVKESVTGVYLKDKL